MTTGIRIATVEDAPAILDIYTPIIRETVISFEFDPPPVEEIRKRIASTLERCPWLVCERGDEVLGYAYADRHAERAAYQWGADVSVYVSASVRRGGVGRALYTSLLRVLYVQGYYLACAGITLPNPASVGLHESFGFEPIGVYPKVGWKFGAWYDVGWWQLTLRPRVPDPVPPAPFPAMRSSEDCAAAVAAGVPLLRL